MYNFIYQKWIQCIVCYNVYDSNNMEYQTVATMINGYKLGNDGEFI